MATDLVLHHLHLYLDCHSAALRASKNGGDQSRNTMLEARQLTLSVERVCCETWPMSSCSFTLAVDTDQQSPLQK